MPRDRELQVLQGGTETEEGLNLSSDRIPAAFARTLRHVDLDPSHPPDPKTVALLEDLAAIQQKIQQPIRIRSGQTLSAEELHTVAKLRTILHEGGLVTTWAEYTLNLLTPGVRQVLGKFGGGKVAEIRIETEETEQLFGVDLALGRIRFTFQARLANEQEVRARLAQAQTDNDIIAVRFVPADDPMLRTDYLDWQPPVPVEGTEGPERSTVEGDAAAGIPSPENVEQEDTRRRRISAALAGNESPSPPPPGAWRQMLGMFDNDPIMHDIFEAGRRIREAERSE